MDSDSRQIMMMLIWMFMQHGRSDKAIVLAQALYEALPDDAVCAAVYSRLLLDDALPGQALKVLRSCNFPNDLQRMRALMEARALKTMGKAEEGRRVWNDYLKNHRTRNTRRKIDR